MRLSPLLLLAFALSACRAEPPANSAANEAAPATALSTVPLRIATATGRRTIDVELAISEGEQEQGLMHRTALPSGHGMLFPFAMPKMASFWMKDTVIPLDLIFIRPDGRVAAILSGKPNDLTPLSANDPATAVLEIAGGEATRLGLAVGDRIEWGECKDGRQKPGEPINPLAFCP
jgi:uncharacterized membrane protein (UPF0127 family)